MKRDIKVNYGILSSIVSDLKQYNEAIESIDGLLININKKLENENDGKAIEALRNKYDKLKVQIDSCKEETKDLYNIFNNYINDMTDIIKPIDEQKMMRVSRNDIYFNKVSIGNACDNIGSIMSGILTSLGSAGTLLTSGTKIKNNIVKMYAISSLAKATSQSLQNDMDDINKLYNENVISYENMDDTYKNKASELYDKYSSVWEKFTTTVGGIGKASVDIVKGFFSSLVGLVKGVFDILKAAVVYIGAGIGAISEKITGDAPDCLKSCERKVKEYNKTIVEIVKDPFSLIEGLSQTLNDTYEEKGIAYMGGYVVGEVAQVLLLKKVSGAKSAKGIDGVEDAAKTVKNVDKAEDGSKIAKESSAIKGVSKAGDEMVTYRRVQGGTPPNASWTRITVDESGNIKIPNKKANLNVSTGNDEHAKYFLSKRGSNAEIVEFDIPTWLDDFLQENAINQKGYRKNPLNQRGTAPKIVDPTTPGNSYELPAPWIEWLEEYGKNGRRIK